MHLLRRFNNKIHILKEHHMNTCSEKTWNAAPYLDTLASALVIVVTAAIVILAATTAFGDARAGDRAESHHCPPGAGTAASYEEQRPGGPRTAEPVMCV